MPTERWRLDLRKDVQGAVSDYTSDAVEASAAVVAAVLPHFELAYQRGLVAGRSQAGYRARAPKEE